MPTARINRHIVLHALLLLVLIAGAAEANDATVVFPERVPQGAMVIGKVPPGSRVVHADRELRVTDYGSVVFGVARDASGTAAVTVTPPGASERTVRIAIAPRDWPIERVDGVPPKTVDPPPEIAERIGREQQAVARARETSDDGIGFTQDFIRPVPGRISGRFGNQRIYNGTPGSAHSGMDIAAATGTPVKAPAAGRVVFADDLYLTGGTVLIDHGHGIGSNFLHLSKMNVGVGETVEQGEIIGEVGATGRATGPHLHWGMTWYATRIDPLLVLER
nr:M23 family metallopeptidase [Salinisphaera halophila]